MDTKKHLTVVICACLVLLGIVASVQINERQMASEYRTDIARPNNSSTKTQPLTIDPRFLEQEDTVTKPPAVGKPVSPAIPGLTARAYLVGDIKTGKIYIQANASRAVPVASMSKLVTAFAATDMMDPMMAIYISSSTLAVPPDASNLQVHETFTLKEILQPLLLSSSNVAAEAIAHSNNRPKFMDMMRGYAWEIGMPQSFFADPSGVSPDNIASARDLFELAKYLVGHRPDILAITRTDEMAIATTTEHGGHTIMNTHPFVKDPRFVGGKTGRTSQAGETMMTILNIDGDMIAFIILGSNFGSRENDTSILIRELEKKK